ncbi:carbohydrate-binding protein [Streptomyces sp. TRM66268-LWL]|uniref:Carbohydrate-binding protein n=1 Tax=Streptomyces polyasparticus TaxID=2767826 RepID=A0ABR7SBC2_9ACTN|nr:carbohydrate-binding protein [Streptomyces polyasparticus]MBC9712771.1 carbohydrate-binding protein [Streptomyces polyasparticus]
MPSKRSSLSLLAIAALSAGTALVLPGTPASAATTRYEAEVSPATCDGTIDTNHTGFSGTGFCNGRNATGAALQFTVNASEAGTATLAFRYANGSGAARPADVAVNGTAAGSLTFAATSTWTAWTTQTLTVPVKAGSNTVRLSPTTASGLANIDALDADTATTTPPPTGSALYVAPNGTDGAAGTQAAPTTLTSAISRITPGGTIHMRGGTYRPTQTITIPATNNGTASARTKLSAYPGETPVLNFSAQTEDPANRGLAVNGSYWHVSGIVVERAGDNGIFVGGSNNILERTVTRFNRDTGLQLSRMASTTPTAQWPSNNLVLSAESHDNADSDGEDADGFAAKLTVGPGNVFRYAVAHHNIDDGWDLYTKPDTGPIGVVTIEDSLAFGNGTLSDGSQAGAGDRNGYKLGGEDIPVNHIVRRSIAYNNGKHGFTYNSNPGAMTVSDNVSVDNAQRNFSFDAGTHTFRNNTSCRSGSGTNDRIVGNSDSTNQFWMGTNGSRCSSYDGAMKWSFAADGRLVVTFG